MRRVGSATATSNTVTSSHVHLAHNLSACDLPQSIKPTAADSRNGCIQLWVLRGESVVVCSGGRVGDVIVIDAAEQTRGDVVAEFF
jgi:hypothetical protein